ncbi:hypothetical protein [Caulobacter radicis]|uniref:hypothetical protein n=1 Tax=Caulobacter radicis TaxID=2172650 RepID=UPI0010577F4C|nr:hypothetical protein [Caulobacter radicis]
MEAACSLGQRFYNELEGDDPFAYNETASVSHLTAAASLSGYLALAEFATAKKARHNRRLRASGRSDFWLCSNKRSWAFEFKQITYGPLTSPKLRAKMEEAEQCARCICEADADLAVAGLIVSTYWQDWPINHDTLRSIEGFSKHCDFAWRLETAPEAFTYMFFNVRRPRRA